MNIFKVFASAKKGFQEEYASAILVWLLNPSMEHGLGYAFLAEFLLEISKKEKQKPIEVIAKELRTTLRNDSTELTGCTTYLEHYAGQRYIDIVIKLATRGGNLIIAIENKIFGLSASDETQLLTEYRGIKDDSKLCLKDDGVLMIFLVPLEDGSLCDGIKKEWGNLSVDSGDYKALVTWNETDKTAANYASVSKVINSLLEKEAHGEINPINEYVRHTLKALRRFIDDGFIGYPYVRQEVKGLNSSTEELVTYREILEKTDGWVGVQYGIRGLLTLLADAASRGGNIDQNRYFQYTTKKMSKSQWLHVDTFRNIVASITSQKDSGKLEWLNLIKEKSKLSTQIVLFVYSKTKKEFYVGKDDGLAVANRLGKDGLASQTWKVRTNPKRNKKEWFSVKELAEIFEKVDEADTSHTLLQEERR